MKRSILVVDDEPSLRSTVAQIMEQEGHRVRTAGSAAEAFQALQKVVPDLILLDVRLPDKDGFDICREIRRDSAWKSIPIIFLSSEKEEPQRVAGLDLGADDYIAKPFSNREVASRVRAVLRRRYPEDESTLLTEDKILLDPERRKVTVEDRPLTLAKREFDLLEMLIRKKGRVLSRRLLLDALWGEESLDTRSLDTHIYRLRKELGPEGKHIHNVSGVGYKWE